MTLTIESGALAAPLADLKAYLRIGLDDEDALLSDLIRAAGDVAERFTGQLLVERGVEEVLDARADWQPLGVRPVTSITAVAGVAAGGDAVALPVEAYALDIDGHGDGWVRVLDPGAARRIHVSYRAGLAADADHVPDAIRHGIIRLAGDYHALREGVEPHPPASVAALWRPWRRMRLK
jgi:uncharacterized phiE125 gp8 family phage protein